MFIDKIKVPEGMDRYILKNIARAYLYVNQKEKTVYCTACGQTFDLNHDAKHNEDTQCPNCGKFAKTKLSHYGRKTLRYKGGVFWFQKDDANTLAGLVGFDVNYSSPKEPEISYYPVAAYQISAQKQEYYRYAYNYAKHKWNWEPRRKILLPQTNGMFEHVGEISFYKPSISELGTDFKYLDFDSLSRPIKTDLLKRPEVLFNYMLKFIRHKSTELLIKAGFEILVYENAVYGAPSYNVRGKTLEKALKMTKGEIKELPRNIKDYDLKAYQIAKKIFPNAKPEIIKLINPYIRPERLEMLTEYEEGPLYKYLIKNEIEIRDYIDYLEDVKALGLPETKRTLRPKNFDEEHEKLASRRAQAMLMQKNKDFVKYEKKIAFRPYEEDNYIITLPKSPIELVKEGEAQHHCVGTYVNMVASGECAIVFLRKKENPKKPFYTIELSPDREIVQCRGSYNSGYDDEVKAVLMRYKRWLKEEYHEWIKNAE